jgi:hypothetical protein
METQACHIPLPENLSASGWGWGWGYFNSHKALRHKIPSVLACCCPWDYRELWFTSIQGRG